MAVSVDKFNVPDGASGVLVQPKLAYRFRVELTNFGGSDGSAHMQPLTSQVVSVSRPSVTHDDVVLDVYNSRVFLAGKHTWDPVTLTVRDDITGSVSKAVAAQLQRQMNHAAQSGQRAGQNYKFTTKITQLDGGNDGAEVVLDTWELAGCYIQNVNYGENNYATSDPIQLTIAIKYDNANHTVAGVAALEAAPSITSSGDNSSANG
jgi:uncharacterized lipoprotein YmbA